MGNCPPQGPGRHSRQLLYLRGDSISAASVVRELEAFTGKKLELPLIFQAPTIEQIANILLSENSESGSYLIPIRPEGSQKPIFLVPGHGGDIFTYSYLARYLDSDYPLYVFRFPDAARLDNEVANKTIMEMASQYVQELMALQPYGPYKVLGFCFGGELAFEIAQQLRAKGKKTGLVGIIHVELPETYLGYRLKDRIASHWKNLRSGGFKNAANYVKSASVRLADRLSRRIFPSVSRRFVPAPPGRTYFPQYYPGRITLFQTKNLTGESDYYTDMGWKGLVAEAEVFSLPGNRFTTFVEPEVHILAKHLNSCLKDISE